MKRLIKLKLPVIVEGKYDKITLENIIDATIIPTNGFGIFKDKEKCDMIRMLAQKNGVIILTDSDSAGNMIRSHIKKIVNGANIINVYVPQIKGKEKRKNHSGKEGILGVEGMTKEVIEAALKKSGVNFDDSPKKSQKITKCDMFTLGLSGGNNSSEKRKKLLSELGLPDNLSSSAMLDILNTLFSIEEFFEVVNKWRAKETEN